MRTVSILFSNECQSVGLVRPSILKRTIFGKTSQQRLSLFVDEVEQRFKMDMETRRKKPAQEQLSRF
jgi:hypothetical protein